MQAIKDWMRANPDQGKALMRENFSYIFFKQLTGPGPLGALNVPAAGTTVLATHHLEEIPATTTHAALLRTGGVVAAGPIDHVLTTELLEACFEVPIELAHADGRWSARARA